MGPAVIVGIVKVRNEEEIIESTLDHYADICDGGIMVLDDASEDGTLGIVEAHGAVRYVIRVREWSEDWRERQVLEGTLRERLFRSALDRGAEYVLAFDADERIEIDPDIDIGSSEGWYFRLWDYYITAEDVDQGWESRRWIGPEYRDILMLVRATRRVWFSDREPTLPRGWEPQRGGDCRHYGKAISVEEWEATCDYYSQFRSPEYRKKWLARKGKAVHTESDFGRPLCRWADREREGVRL